MTKHVFTKFIKFSFKMYKSYYFILLLKIIISSITVLLSAYTISLIISFLEVNDKSKALIASATLVAIEVFLSLISKYINYLYTNSEAKMREKVDHTLANKIMNIPFQYLEDPKYLELKKDAQMAINNMGAIYDLLNSISRIAASILSIFGLITIIISFDPILVVILVVGIILNVLFVLLSMKTQMKFYNDLLPINYKYGYCFDVLLSKDAAKDFRLFPIYNLIKSKFEKLKIATDSYFVKILNKQAFYTSLISTVRYVQMALIYVLVGIRTIINHFSISSFSLTISSAIEFSNCVSSIITSTSNFLRSIQYISPMIELLEIKDIKTGEIKVLENITNIKFDHVTFKYPNTEKIILDDISFEIMKNEKISIIGLNGAGKTTIVKLICRLYKPTQGTIYINEIPIDDYDFDTYINLVSTVFQDYKLFSYSILDNISPGIEYNKAKKLCSDVGIDNKIEELPLKYNSILSKSYDVNGIELSGGQSQKLAIARALAKDASLLILDEPTSALDPLAEAEIYENFNQLTVGKTAIYISHRMSSSIFCDKILVLDNGKVIDYDNHNELMKKKDSIYYKLFTTQAKNYQIN